jgi:dTDP-4-amino-4,6-dideoxygalactose transaminase
MASNEFLPFTRPCIDEATIAGVAEVLRSGWITTGPAVQKFEAELSAFFGGRPVRTFASGTGTMEIGLVLAGVGPGDEVITTALSWVATSNVIVRLGAKPVFVDIDPATRNIDIDRVEAAITPRTRALLPVDIAGLPFDRDRLYAIARRNRLRVVEDSAQSMGARWKGQRIGAIGDLVSISFQANKNMTTTEGGCLVVNTAEEARQCELWRLQGVERFADGESDCTVAGIKHNMTDVAACIGLGQLRRLDEFNARRRALAQLYFEQFDRSLGCGLPMADFDHSNWHMFQVVLPDDIVRGEFILAMKERGIGIGVHYPSIPSLTLYRRMGFRSGDFPVAERVGRGIATLPLFPLMQDADVTRVCRTTAEVLAQLRSRQARRA